MNQVLKLTAKRYFIFLFLLSFASIILSPDFHSKGLGGLPKVACMLFVYRCNIFSIFSLLFATLSAIQTHQKENVDVAISMSGVHSFKTLLPTYLFSLFLSAVYLSMNNSLLGEAIKVLQKEKHFSSYNDKIQVYLLGEEVFFYQNDLENFTFITESGDVHYAKKATQDRGGFHLHYYDYFSWSDSGYTKTNEARTFYLEKDLSNLAKHSTLKNSANLFTLYNAFDTKGENANMVKVTFWYRVFLPLLNIFAVSLAAIIGFYRPFRRKYYLSTSAAIFFSLFFFYLLECTSILAANSIISPLFFCSLCSVLLTGFPLLSYKMKI